MLVNTDILLQLFFLLKDATSRLGTCHLGVRVAGIVPLCYTCVWERLFPGASVKPTFYPFQRGARLLSYYVFLLGSVIFWLSPSPLAGYKMLNCGKRSSSHQALTWCHGRSLGGQHVDRARLFFCCSLGSKKVGDRVGRT